MRRGTAAFAVTAAPASAEDTTAATSRLRTLQKPFKKQPGPNGTPTNSAATTTQSPA
jgi:hypothetical protein